MKIVKTFAAVLLAVASLTAQADQKFLNIVTGGTAGVYYPLGVALSQLYGHELEGVKPSVQSTKGSVENLTLLQKGRAELGFALADVASEAWRGDAGRGFAQPFDKLRAVAGIYSNYLHLVASADSGIKTLADLKGKRISVGAPKSGNELNARSIITAAGLTYDDFSKVEYLPFAESVELLKNRQIDVTLVSGGIGVSAVRDLSTAVPIVFVKIPHETVEKIGDPAYQVGTIPAGVYEGQDAEVSTVRIRNLLVTSDVLSDDDVYAMTKVLFDNLDSLANAHAAAKEISLESAADGLPIPLHSGAERY